MPSCYHGGRVEAHIEVEGLRELQMAIRRACGKLPDALGQAHKRVGTFVISRLTPPSDPHAVGAGRGAAVRASASKREVLLRAGQGQREGNKAQWGSTPVQPFQSGRPYIVKAIEDNESDIRQMFMDETMAVLGPAFFTAE